MQQVKFFIRATLNIVKSLVFLYKQVTICRCSLVYYTKTRLCAGNLSLLTYIWILLSLMQLDMRIRLKEIWLVFVDHFPMIFPPFSRITLASIPTPSIKYSPYAYWSPNPKIATVFLVKSMSLNSFLINVLFFSCMKFFVIHLKHFITI